MVKVSAKAKIRQFFLANIGRVVTAKEIRDAVPEVSEWARRVRELREEGWPIQTHHDVSSFKPGQYRLTEAPKTEDIRFSPGISQKIRAQVLDRNGFTCQMCGLCPGDTDPYTGRKVRLHIGHIQDRSIKGEVNLSNLRTLCSTCNQGAKNVTLEKPSEIWLLGQVRRANIDVQRSVFDWLRKKFDEQGRGEAT